MENKTDIDSKENEQKERLSPSDCAAGVTRKEKNLASGEEKKAASANRYLYYSQLFNSVVLGFLLVVLSAISLKGYFFFGSLEDFAVINSKKITQTISNVETSSKALEQSAKAVQQVSEAQNKILTDSKTQENIAVLLRQADDLARLVKNANIALNQVNREVLPSANRALDASTNTINQAGATLRQTETTIRVLTAKGEIILDSSNASIRALEAILAQPNLKVIIDNLAATSGESIETVKQLNISAEEINKALPELVAKVKAIGDNTDLSGKEITTFLNSLNKPLSKKQKAFRFILETVIKSSPVLLKR
jgi:uncharacterized protein YukE